MLCDSGEKITSKTRHQREPFPHAFPQTRRHTQALVPSRTATVDLLVHGHLRGIESAETPEVRRGALVVALDPRDRVRGVAAPGPVAIRALPMCGAAIPATERQESGSEVAQHRNETFSVNGVYYVQ